MWSFTCAPSHVAPAALKTPHPCRLVVGWIQDVLAEKDSLLRGLTLLLGGAALVLAGSMIGLNAAKATQITAGLVATTGVVTMFLGFFIYVLPPLLPAK